LHREGTYYRRAKRDGKWKWESLGNDANAAYAKLDVPPVIPVNSAGKGEAAAPTVKDGFRIDDEIEVYLSNVSKLAPRPIRRIDAVSNCSSGLIAGVLAGYASHLTLDFFTPMSLPVF
jgi:hypothetical protein